MASFILITGASSGFGAATAKLFASKGYGLVLMARRKDKLEALVQELPKNIEAHILVADVRDEVLVTNAINSLPEHVKTTLSILVNNAGSSAAMGLAFVEDDLWMSDFNLKVMAAVRLSRLAIPIMAERGGGAIVNASIGGGKAPNAGALPTSVMRAAGLNLTKSLAQEFAASNIRVNAICIGYLKSMQWIRRAENGDPSSIYENFAQKIPLGRIGEAEEYADLVAFLSSKRASYITGTAVNLDGGLCPVV